ncbi:MAG: hypothetical protein KDJ52_23675 [Anaerolineae bacterium]|nr:hypothetical protein [Anaerolineae bacterium]
MMKQPDIFVAIKPVVEAFEKLGVSYCIGGSVASSAYGLARATMDIDVVAHLKSSQVSSLVKMLESSYYIDTDMILDAIDKYSSFNLIHLETMLKVDVFILKNEAYQQTSFQRRRKDTLGDDEDLTEFYFLSPEDIILNKLDWYRMGGGISERQWNDILGVLKVQHKSLDIAYLQAWASHLNLTDLLKQAFGETGINLSPPI